MWSSNNERSTRNVSRKEKILEFQEIKRILNKTWKNLR